MVNLFMALAHRIEHFRNRERRKSFGNENPDKVFYIIRVDFPMAGLFAIVKSILSHIVYAVDRGYIPIVDMIHGLNQFQKDLKGNPWEFFFNQPTKYGLDDIKKSKNVIISCNRQVPISGYGIGVDVLSKECTIDLERYASFFQQYIIYADKTKEYLLKKYVSIIGEKKNVLGVLCRGTDYLNKRPAFHPVQPSPEVVINEIEGLMKVYRIDYIYLATEDIVILEVFREAFGDMVLCINQKRFDNIEEDYICDCSFQNEERIQMNLDYLASLYILSKCEYFIGGRTSGTIGVNLMPHNYRYTYFWNLGTYPNHD